MKQYTLPKCERLYLRESIGELYAKGTAFTAYPLRVMYYWRDRATLSDKQDACAVMTVVPKRRFKHAVDRNRLKRLMREAYRLQKLPLREGVEHDGRAVEISFVYIGSQLATYDQICKAMNRAIVKLSKTCSNS